MKTRRYIGKWFILILLLAIGIGTFAALTLSDEKAREGSEARPSSYLTNQRKHDIDMKALAEYEGEYQAEGEQSYWHLSVRTDYEDKGPYLSVYDNGAGNPGFEGRIMYLKDEIIIVEIDPDYFEDMPEGWEPEGDDKYAILDISKSNEDIILGYRGANIKFIHE